MQQTDFTNQRTKQSRDPVKPSSHRLRRVHTRVLSSRLITSPNKPLRWLSGGLTVFFGLLLISWLISAGIPSLFISPYPKVILVVPTQFQSQPITQMGAIFLHQRSHRTKSWFITSQNPLELGDNSSGNTIAQVSQELGLAISDIVFVDETVVTAKFRWQLLKSALAHWQKPSLFWQKATVALLAPNPQTEQKTSFRQWGELVARELQPLETASANCSMGVSNTTGQSGLGRRMADFLSNQGVVIRRVTDSEESLSTTQLLIDQDQVLPCQALQTELLHVLPAGVSVTEKEGVSQEFRIPLLVLMGSDSAALFKP